MIAVQPVRPHNFLLLMHTKHTELMERARALFPAIPDENILVLCRDRTTALSYNGIGRAVMQDWDDIVEETAHSRIDSYYDACGGNVHGNPVMFFPDTTHGDIMRMMRCVFDHEDDISPWYSMSIDGTLVE